MLAFFGKKPQENYKGISILADLGMHMQIFEELSVLAKPNSRVLDLGCGEGAMSQRLVDNGYEVVSVDKEDSKFKCVGSNFVKVDFDDEAEVEAFLSKYSQSFDVVIGLEVIEHVENQWSYIRLLKSLTKKNGLIFISTPNTQSWISRIQFLLNGRFHQFSDIDLKYGHISPISLWEKHLILNKLDLRILKTVSVGTLPHFYFSSISTSLMSIFNIFLRPFMRGNYLNGWCVLTICKR